MGYTRPNKIAFAFGCYSSSPADSTTYYFGIQIGRPLNTGWGSIASLIIPTAGHIKMADFKMTSVTATGTAEDISLYVRVGNVTDYLIQTLGAATSIRDFKNFAMDVPVNQNDTVEIKMVTPAWVTNPDGVYMNGYIVMESE